MKWISVDERTPRTKGWYLVWVVYEKEDHWGRAYNSSAGEWIHTSGYLYGSILGKITHWQSGPPKPQPNAVQPKKEK